MAIRSICYSIRVLNPHFRSSLNSFSKAKSFHLSLYKPKFGRKFQTKVNVLSANGQTSGGSNHRKVSLVGWLALGLSAGGLAIAQLKRSEAVPEPSKLKKELAQKEKSEHGNIIVLVGASSVGKSTIISALRQIDPQMVEEGSDLSGANYMYEFMEKNHERYGVSKEDWEHLHSVLVPRRDHWHIHEAVSKKEGTKASDYDFKPGVAKEDQERAIRTAVRLNRPVDEEARLVDSDAVTMKKVLEHSKSGVNSVFDIMEIDKVSQHPVSQIASLKTVFVYCPFNTLAERITERNRKALSGEIDLSEVRSGSFPLMQYGGLVRPRESTDHANMVIDTVTRKSIEDTLDANFSGWIEAKSKTASAEERDDLCKMAQDGRLNQQRIKDKTALLRAFGFADSDPLGKAIELVPRKKYDMYIDTSDPTLGATSLERGKSAAKKILEA